MCALQFCLQLSFSPKGLIELCDPRGFQINTHQRGESDNFRINYRFWLCFASVLRNNRIH